MGTGPVLTTDAERVRRIAALDFDVASLDFERVPACNLCGSAHHVEVARQDRYGFPVRYVVCARCGLGFLSPRPTAEAYAEFYEAAYRPLVSAFHGRVIDAKTVQEEQRDYARELVAFLRHALPAPPATALDVGGSTGVVGAEVRDAFGSSVTVIDPAPDELAVAASLGLETVQGFAETADLGDRRFDLVLLCQTIDHLLDVRATLASLRRLTADEGHAFVDVLDLMIAARKQGSVQGAVKIDHPYSLTRETALAFFEQAGFAPVAERLSADGHWGFVLSAAEPFEPDWEQLHGVAESHRAELEGLR
jgi:2-polyprenyl-3-methyl-5-hydroxy-6-metoxy-1,4-benzoquinol methylase